MGLGHGYSTFDLGSRIIAFLNSIASICVVYPSCAITKVRKISIYNINEVYLYISCRTVVIMQSALDRNKVKSNSCKTKGIKTLIRSTTGLLFKNRNSNGDYLPQAFHPSPAICDTL